MQILDFHRGLVSDRAGQESFRKAIFETIRGGEIVLDLGTGTGIHALFACQAGAKRVYGVDQHEVIALASEVCQANGYADRICFLHAPAAEIDLPEKVDVIVTHHGLGGLFKLLPDARDRFLKKGGRLIPASVDFFCAPLEAPRAYDEKIRFWQMPRHELTFVPVLSLAINTMHDWDIDTAELLGEPVHLASYDFSQVKEAKLSKAVETDIARPGILHGVGLWYTEWLTDEIALPTGPASTLPFPLWTNGFLPIASPVPLQPGERVRIKIQTGTGGWAKFWNWEVAVKDRRGGEKARFVHSTFSGWLLPKDTLRKQSLDYVPRLTPLGAAQLFVLENCDGSKSLRWIEEEVCRRFPNLFKDSAEAAAFVGEVIARLAA